MAKGWHRESKRHSLASRGIKSAQRIPKLELNKADKNRAYRNLEIKLTHLELKKVIWEIIMKNKWYGLVKPVIVVTEMKKRGIYKKSMNFFEQSDRHRIPYRTENRDEEMVYNMMDMMGHGVVKLNTHVGWVISFTVDPFTAKREYDQTKRSLIDSKKKFEQLDNIKWEDYKKITKELRRK